MVFFLNKGFLPTIVSLDKTKVCTLASLQGWLQTWICNIIKKWNNYKA